MSMQTEKTKDNLLVKLVKKSVGLPTGESGCCGTVPQDKENESCCGEQPSAANEETDSGCAETESGCCDTVSQDKEVTSCCGG